ncbi:MAG: hypothetical protein H2049_12120 [Porphyrobacter sp.]|nr:hypothetical protein [Porphyrobacter sp.]
MEQLTAFLIILLGLAGFLALPIPFAYLFNRTLAHESVETRATLAALCGSVCFTVVLRLIAPSFGLLFDLFFTFLFAVTLALPMFPIAFLIAKKRKT